MTSPRQRWETQRSVAGFRWCNRAGRFLPGSLLHRFAARAARRLARTETASTAHIRRHLQRVDPTLLGYRLDRAVEAACVSYARYWVETFRLPHLDDATVAAGFSASGYEQIPAALERGVGAILALPHLGGWEWAGRWLVQQGHPVTVVVEALEPPELYEEFLALRTSLGMRVLPLAADTGRLVAAALRSGHIVCLLSDRNIGASGVTVPFFGEETSLPAGPVALGLRTGAPIFPTTVYFTDETDGHHAVVGPPLRWEAPDTTVRTNITHGTAALARRFEYLIAQQPEQWHLFQPNWPSDPGYQR